MKVTFKKDYRGWREGESVDFGDRAVNLIVGENGCGKTALLDAIRGALYVRSKPGPHQDAPDEWFKDLPDVAEAVERDENARLIEFFHSDHVLARASATSFFDAGLIGAGGQSAGEEQFTHVGRRLAEIADSGALIALLDEPELHMSEPHRLKIAELIWRAVMSSEGQKRFFVTTHNPNWSFYAEECYHVPSRSWKPVRDELYTCREAMRDAQEIFGENDELFDRLPPHVLVKALIKQGLEIPARLKRFIVDPRKDFSKYRA